MIISLPISPLTASVSSAVPVGGQKLTDAENGMSVEQVMGWNAPTVPAVANDGAIGDLG